MASLMTETFFSSPVLLNPAPRPAVILPSTFRRDAAMAADVVVFPMPISPTQINSYFLFLSSETMTLPNDKATSISSFVMAGSLRKFLAPHLIFLSITFGIFAE